LVAAPTVRGVALLAGAASAPPAAGDLGSRGASAAERLVAGFQGSTSEDPGVHSRLRRDESGASTLCVVETFVAVFPEFDQNRGMRRAIPDTYNGQPLTPEFVSITDGHGNPRPAEVEHDDGEFRMTSRADGYVHGVQ